MVTSFGRPRFRTETAVLTGFACSGAAFPHRVRTRFPRSPPRIPAGKRTASHPKISPVNVYVKNSTFGAPLEQHGARSENRLDVADLAH